MTVIHTPPGFDRAALLGRLNSAALEHSPEYRRAITRTSPVLFALVYFIDHLRCRDGSGDVSLSQMHVDMARAARQWVRSDFRPGEERIIWIGPRESAKSTWRLIILPTWAAAHQHPVGRYSLFFADAQAQAQKHLRSVRDEFRTNELLRHDFPELCEPERGQDRAGQYVARSGAVLGAAGITTAVLGDKVRQQRPTNLCLDDIEPEQSDYDATTKPRRLSAVQNKILPMSIAAPVHWSATTTAYGSLAHDAVRSVTGGQVAPWLSELGFRVRYYPAIMVDDDGSERSAWPQQWDLGWLQSIRGTEMYAMQYANLPRSSGNGLWRPEHVAVADVPVSGRVLMVDPAVTSRRSSDETGLAVVGVERGGRRRAVVEYATGMRGNADELRARVRKILAANRTAAPIRRVLVERNNGGDLWLDALRPVVEQFPEVELDLHWSEESKEDRFERAHDWYVLGMAVHSRALPRLTDQLFAYPELAHDDVMDAATAGLERFLKDRPLERLAS